MQYDILLPCFPILDVIVPIEGTLPIEAGTSVIVHQIQDEAGGPANTFFAAARMGANVLPVGAVGNDDHGRFLLRTYQEEGIDTSCVLQWPDYVTPQALCINDKNGMHAFITMVHGELPISAESLCGYMDQARSLALTGYILASPNVENTVLELLRHAHGLHREVFFDPGPLIDKISSSLLRTTLAMTTVLIVNDEEAARLSGEGTVEGMAAALKDKSHGATIVIKAGAQGCYILHQGVGCWYPGFQVTLADTTGAGDSFMGAFMHGWLSRWDIKTVATLANAAGAAKTAKPGSGRQVPTFQEVAAILRRNGYPVPEANETAGKFVCLAF